MAFAPAPGGGTTTFGAFNAITTLDSFELSRNVAGSLGDALENQPGVAKRSFGPGSSRPIIRGFDGDRVLMMEDGIGTGDLASQSGDHGVTIDPNGLERIEVVRGPATLLYGSNAVGGVVNAVTPHENYRDSMTEGTRGQLSADAGTANTQAGTNASVQHARGNLMLWAAGGARRSDDYETPEGTVENSETRLTTGRAGVGYLGERLFSSGGFTLEDSRYGVPFAGALVGEEDAEVSVDIDSQRRVGRFDVRDAERGDQRARRLSRRGQRDRLGTRRDRNRGRGRACGNQVQQPDLRRASRVRPASDDLSLW